MGLALLLQAACTAEARAPVNAPEPAPAQRKTQTDEAKTVSDEHKALVLQALERIETRCWLDADADPLLELLAPDAPIVAARGASAGPHDVRFSKAAFTALMRNQCAQPVRAAFDMQEPELKLDSQQVHAIAQGVEVHQVRVFRGFSTTERVAERFVFHVDEAKTLQIRSLWYYPLSTHAPVGDSFDSARLPDLDAKAEQTTEPLARAYALFSALRYAEASDLHCDLAAAPGADAASWLACANSSLFAAQPERAQQAFTAARRLDPLISVPLPNE